MVIFCSVSCFFSRLGYVIWILVIAISVYLCCSLDFDEPAVSVLIPATHIGLEFSTMTSEKKCCVPNCGSVNETLHKFPNPAKDPIRFRTWLYNIGGDILSLDNHIIFQRRRVCHIHFEICYHTRSKMLTANAIPSLYLPGILTARVPLKDFTNKPIPCSSTSAQLPSDEPLPGLSNICNQRELNQHLIELKSKQPPSRKSKMAKVMDKNEKLLVNEIKKLKKNNESYKSRLSKALKLSTNSAFQTAIKKFKTLAALFTIMQFREISKPKMGRRFTKEEKIMALSIYKQGPKAYRWLKNIFVLPSPVTLSRMISRAALKPGINENIFEQLRKKGLKMKMDDKLCTLIFDEMSLTPHFDYNRKKDKISGFVNHTGQTTKKIADHVLVYMIRGVTRNYKQPIYYSFCSGSTPKEVLAIQIKDIIKKLHSIGFTVLATICDQGTSNTSAINYLVEETRADYIRRNEELRNYIFEIERKKIIPLFDVPHLLKGIRNNLLTKNLKYTMNGEEKTAKWEHITQLYENNPMYKGLKIVKNLTENHCIRDKIPKMKVKYASQLFSQTVGKTMGYLADNGLLPEETKDTADLIIFIDN